VGVKIKRVETRVEVGGRGMEWVGTWEPCWHEGTCCVGLVLWVDNQGTTKQNKHFFYFCFKEFLLLLLWIMG